ncbi:hypothetical protein HYPSUDRAFT_59125 [Hypholoma sublateritium FD-334 SS-4]|uniref:Uncharacterized protein n=1 Tax=Hypholoma sublateritium (strain FD-334 SS-4) TaxID=945553 RepID=A0A0D2P2S6_HYPSF|nr:hypothetical protein HYPSUDRAFT_59125 [Hypholoma sublateritium FD-334 SS-4]
MSTDVSESIPQNLLVFRTITHLLSLLPRTPPSNPISVFNQKQDGSHAMRQQLKLSDAFARLAVAEHDVVTVSVKSYGYSSDGLEVIAAMNQKEPGDSDNSGQNTVLHRGLPTRIILWVVAFFLTRKIIQATQPRVSYQKIQQRFGNEKLSKPFIDSLESVAADAVPKPSTSTWIQWHNGLSNDKEEAMHDYILLTDFVIRSENDDKILADKKFPELLVLAKHMLNGGTSTEGSTDPITSIYNDATRSEFHTLLTQLLTCFGNALKDLCTSDTTSTAENPCDTTSTAENHSKSRKVAMTKVQMYVYALLRMSRGQAFRVHIQNIRHLLSDWYRTNRPPPRTESRTDTDSNSGNVNEAEVDEDLEAIQPQIYSGVIPQNFIDWLQLVVAHFDAVDVVYRFVTSSSFHYNYISATILVSPTSPKEIYPWRKMLVDPIFPQMHNDLVQKLSISNIDLLNFLEVAVSQATATSTRFDWIKGVQTTWKKKPNSANLDHLIDNLVQAHEADKQHLQMLITKEEDADEKAELEKQALLASDLHDTAEAINNMIAPWRSLSSQIYDLQKQAEAKGRLGEEEVTKNILEKKDKLLADFLPLTMGITMKVQKLFCELQAHVRPGDYLLRSFDQKLLPSSIHCEACLASLLDNFTAKYQETDSDPSQYGTLTAVLDITKGYDRIIGVSKCCCPVCSTFLDVMQEDVKGLPFVVQGSHSIISACTLPPWTPAAVVNEMVSRFGALLRQDLVSLMQRLNADSGSGFGRNHSDSTGSDTYSNYSSESAPEGMNQNVAANAWAS